MSLGETSSRSKVLRGLTSGRCLNRTQAFGRKSKLIRLQGACRSFRCPEYSPVTTLAYLHGCFIILFKSMNRWELNLLK